MTFNEIMEKGQTLAPAYVRVADDGASFCCDICGLRYHADKMVKTFTPDGRNHKLSCIECLDEEWFANATDITRVFGCKL